MDCEFQTLACGPEGYVVWCRRCGQVQLAFLTTVLSLSPDELDSFSRQMKRVLYGRDDSAFRNEEFFYISTPLAGVCLCLRHFEAGRLCLLLEEAELEFKAQSLLALFRS
ncbi:MAG TPA: hypothetical protein VG890_01060 [Puia sp.]|nr:hypothetical protein [Puia sp.]